MRTLKLSLITLFLLVQFDNISANDNVGFENPNEHKKLKDVKEVKNGNVYEDEILYKNQYEPIFQELEQIEKEVEGISRNMQSDNISANDNGRFKNHNEHRMLNEIEEVEDGNVYEDEILYNYQYEPYLQYMEQLKLLLSLAEEVGRLKDEIDSKDQEIKSLKNRIDDFLNKTDITVFGDGFMHFSMDDIAPRSKEFYSLITDIHDLNQLLIEIEKLPMAQYSIFGNKLIEAEELIYKINSYADVENRSITDFLSDEQKNFYNDLVDKYNELSRYRPD